MTTEERQAVIDELAEITMQNGPCPECMGTGVHQQRRPNGNTATCGDCGGTGERPQPGLGEVRSVLWTVCRPSYSPGGTTDWYCGPHGSKITHLVLETFWDTKPDWMLDVALRQACLMDGVSIAHTPVGMEVVPSISVILRAVKERA